MNKLQRPARPRSHNRVAAVMFHTVRYSSKGRSRLAIDASISRSAITRLLAGQTRPTFVVVAKIARALEQQLGQPLDPRELLSTSGDYPTMFVCQLCGCKGCLPEAFHSEDPKIRTQWAGTQPGMWTGDNQETKAAKWQKIEEVQCESQS